MSINRYDLSIDPNYPSVCGHVMDEDTNGSYVDFTEHLEEIEHLRIELAQVRAEFSVALSERGHKINRLVAALERLNQCFESNRVIPKETMEDLRPDWLTEALAIKP